MPLGPFVDNTIRPLTCLGRNGAIDPQIFRDRGAVWLLYKAEGSPDRLMVRRLTATAAGFGPTTRNYTLLAPRTQWEGSVVENPAMIRFHRRLYLFYSANGYKSARYATGYDGINTWEDKLNRSEFGQETELRFNSGVNLISDYDKHLLQHWAATMLLAIRMPSNCSKLERFDPGTMDEYRAGHRPQWEVVPFPYGFDREGRTVLKAENQP